MTMRNRYVLFAGIDRYPSGGALDIVRFFDTLQDANDRIESMKKILCDGVLETAEWANALDVESGKVYHYAGNGRWYEAS